MEGSKTIVIFFNDWKVFPSGVNTGGGEVAIKSLAKALKNLGYKIIACANLPEGECIHDGIEYWNFGDDYRIDLIAKRLETIGPYHCLAATLVHPLLHLRQQENCKTKILINHSPNPFSSGLEPATVMNTIDHLVCVSQAQRSNLLIRGVRPEKLTIIKNGFDPEIFPYTPPDNRDWNQLIFIGRLEPAKGIHLLTESFVKLKNDFPNLKLKVFGESKYWPAFAEKIPKLEENVEGLKFMGKVSQEELSKHLSTAGLLVFPSTCFESAGMAVIDAQASGCPALGFNVGGVSEYLLDQICGYVEHEISAPTLTRSIAKLISNPGTLYQMSLNCKSLARTQTWEKTARDFIDLIELIDSDKNKKEHGHSAQVLPEPCQRTFSWIENSVPKVADDHELIRTGHIISWNETEEFCKTLPDYSAPYIWKGLLLENAGKISEALQSYEEALKKSAPSDWQALFRLTMLNLEHGRIPQATKTASELLTRVPDFYYAEALRKIVLKKRRAAGVKHGKIQSSSYNF